MTFEHFRYNMSVPALLSPIQRTPLDVLMGRWSLDTSRRDHCFDAVTQLASPCRLDPFDWNRLREVLEEPVDVERVRSCTNMKMVASATNVETGKARLFDRKQLTAGMVMASACLPLLFRAVEIDGVPYWDGG